MREMRTFAYVSAEMTQVPGPESPCQSPEEAAERALQDAERAMLAAASVWEVDTRDPAGELSRAAAVAAEERLRAAVLAWRAALDGRVALTLGRAGR